MATVITVAFYFVVKIKYNLDVFQEIKEIFDVRWQSR